MCQFCQKFTKRDYFVKLKSVRTLLRIACVADRKSYVVIICASSCEKFTKSEIYSDIAQNHFHISQFDIWRSSKVNQFMRSTERPYTCIWLPICASSKFWSWHAPFRRHSPLKTQLWPLKVIQGQRSSKVKGNEVNWNTIYMHKTYLYVFHINFSHDMHHSEDTAH